jgi:hypothetical protein
MTSEQLVPNTINPLHEPKFWCLLPTLDEATDNGADAGGYPMYLVTQGHKVGISHNL